MTGRLTIAGAVGTVVFATAVAVALIATAISGRGPHGGAARARPVAYPASLQQQPEVLHGAPSPLDRPSAHRARRTARGGADRRGVARAARLPRRPRADDGHAERTAGPRRIGDPALADVVAGWWHAYVAWGQRPGSAVARRDLARVSTGDLFASLTVDPPRRPWAASAAGPLVGLQLYGDRQGLEAILEAGPPGPLEVVLALRLIRTPAGVRVAGVSL